MTYTLYRDFNAPLSPPIPADSSATTVAVNGLLLLSKLEQSQHNSAGARTWGNFALQVSVSRIMSAVIKN